MYMYLIIRCIIKCIYLKLYFCCDIVKKFVIKMYILFYNKIFEFKFFKMIIFE